MLKSGGGREEEEDASEKGCGAHGHLAEEREAVAEGGRDDTGEEGAACDAEGEDEEVVAASRDGDGLRRLEVGDDSYANVAVDQVDAHCAEQREAHHPGHGFSTLDEGRHLARGIRL